MTSTSLARKKKASEPVVGAGLPGAFPAAIPPMIAPQLAPLTRSPPSGGAWIHETKYDGYRMLGRIEAGTARLISRNGRDWTSSFPTVVRALERLPVTTAWIDGEVVVITEDGRTSFQALQNAIAGEAAGALQYFAFDACTWKAWIYKEHCSLTARPYCKGC